MRAPEQLMLKNLPVVQQQHVISVEAVTNYE